MDSATLAQLIWLLPLLLLAGAVAGVLAGLLGVGGGIVVVPALYHIFGYVGVPDEIRMHLAVGTSLATIIPTSIRSVLAHRARNSFDEALFKRWIPGLIVGVLAGSWLANIASFQQLTTIFASIALVVALYMSFGNPDWKLRDGLPRNPLNSVLAAIVGMISAMMGIGGGTLAVPSLSLCGVPIHRCVGTAAGFGLIIAVPGALSFAIGGWGAADLPPLSFGYVNWLGFILIAPTTVLFVPLGAGLAHSLSQSGLRKAFAVFLGITSARMFWDILAT